MHADVQTSRYTCEHIDMDTDMDRCLYIYIHIHIHIHNHRWNILYKIRGLGLLFVTVLLFL